MKRINDCLSSLVLFQDNQSNHNSGWLTAAKMFGITANMFAKNHRKGLSLKLVTISINNLLQ
jgi:hypothetical protein